MTLIKVEKRNGRWVRAETGEPLTVDELHRAYYLGALGKQWEEREEVGHLMTMAMSLPPTDLARLAKYWSDMAEPLVRFDLNQFMDWKRQRDDPLYAEHQRKIKERLLGFREQQFEEFKAEQPPPTAADKAKSPWRGLPDTVALDADPEVLATAARVRELLTYDPHTGVFRWRIDRRCGFEGYLGRRRIAAKAGSVAGHKSSDGRIYISIDDRKYLAHRLAWLLVKGAWPKGIDHRDCDPSNNRWGNLRLATQAQNVRNARIRCNHPTGLKGVSFDKRRGTFYARIRLNGRGHHLGNFDHPEPAHAEYREAARRLHGRFANLGLPKREWQRRWVWFLLSRVHID